MYDIDLNKIRPVIKWAGSKNQSLDALLTKFPSQIDNYYEPFLGSGSVLCGLLCAMHLGEIQVNKLFVNDINKGVISLHYNIATNVEELIDRIEEYAGYFNEAKEIRSESGRKVNIGNEDTIDDVIPKGRLYVYNYLRKIYNNYLDLMDSDSLIHECDFAALFLILNKTCYRGIYRENKAGKFNSAYGYTHGFSPKRSSPKSNSFQQLFDRDQLLELHRMFKLYDISFESLDFSEFLDKHIASGVPTGRHDKRLNGYRAGNFVYLDPPYFPIDASYFTQIHRRCFYPKS